MRHSCTGLFSLYYADESWPQITQRKSYFSSSYANSNSRAPFHCIHTLRPLDNLILYIMSQHKILVTTEVSNIKDSWLLSWERVAHVIWWYNGCGKYAFLCYRCMHTVMYIYNSLSRIVHILSSIFIHKLKNSVFVYFVWVFSCFTLIVPPCILHIIYCFTILRIYLYEEGLAWVSIYFSYSMCYSSNGTREE